MNCSPALSRSFDYARLTPGYSGYGPSSSLGTLHKGAKMGNESLVESLWPREIPLGAHHGTTTWHPHDGAEGCLPFWCEAACSFQQGSHPRHMMLHAKGTHVGSLANAIVHKNSSSKTITTTKHSTKQEASNYSSWTKLVKQLKLATLLTRATTTIKLYQATTTQAIKHKYSKQTTRTRNNTRFILETRLLPGNLHPHWGESFDDWFAH